ncbi:hypothetical protein B0I35DRAFT_161311 [Stachybotrys elegans]|uniref:Zn(2)-C6 fungal-type domain-containing protein n=1 Tax=Stachybotrys elegans TaxID=80388 RepID=A0A8K0T1G8_9HYPO|nr:hypothetical protein B0I35DRAFT_161311 [Stachybotrys elegans]
MPDNPVRPHHRACDRCRTSKMRCFGRDTINEACSPCVSFKSQCVTTYTAPAVQDPSQTSPSSGAHSRPRQRPLMRKAPTNNGDKRRDSVGNVDSVAAGSTASTPDSKQARGGLRRIQPRPSIASSTERSETGSTWALDPSSGSGLEVHLSISPDETVPFSTDELDAWSWSILGSESAQDLFPTTASDASQGFEHELELNTGRPSFIDDSTLVASDIDTTAGFDSIMGRTSPVHFPSIIIPDHHSTLDYSARRATFLDIDYKAPGHERRDSFNTALDASLTRLVFHLSLQLRQAYVEPTRSASCHSDQDDVNLSTAAAPGTSAMNAPSSITEVGAGDNLFVQALSVASEFLGVLRTVNSSASEASSTTILSTLSAYLQIVALFDRLVHALLEGVQTSTQSMPSDSMSGYPHAALLSQGSPKKRQRVGSDAALPNLSTMTGAGAGIGSLQILPDLNLGGFSVDHGKLQAQILLQAILHQLEMIENALGLTAEFRVTKPTNLVGSQGLFGHGGKTEERQRMILDAILTGDFVAPGSRSSLRRRIGEAGRLLSMQTA